jgi:hypothetical protein
MSHAEKWSVLEDSVGPIMAAAISGCMAYGHVLARRTLRRQPGDAPGPIREVVHMRRDRGHFQENVLFIGHGDDWRYLTSFPSCSTGTEFDLHIGEISPARNRAESIVRAALPCGTAVEYFSTDYISSCRKYLAADAARVRLSSLGLSLMPAERRVIGIARPVVDDTSSPLFRAQATRLQAVKPHQKPQSRLGLELDLTHLAAFDSRPDTPDLWRFHTDVVAVRHFDFLGSEFLELQLDWTRSDGHQLTLPLCISAASLGDWRPRPGQAVSGETWVHADFVA